ncbi:cadherin-like domain-containing protein [Devosia marina]|uniref:Cadherin-like domain-containing protein n=1 Tax=Devosia marina TaxID=2683198 RepID=A0A7X3FRZ4_9HYPH|nr:cadherin-like domain-containing protein [Devosia marina]MVS98835.1 hypothetical protein [Devosia marina]
MLIEVKSAQNDESELKGARRFEFNTAERLTRLPAYLALMVVGIAAYIRSITAAQARLPETDRAEGGEGESVNAPPAQETDDLAVAGIDDTETASIEGEGGRRGLGLEPGNAWPASFVVPEYPRFYFVEPTILATRGHPFSPTALLQFPMNDNFGGQTGSSIGSSTPLTSSPADFGQGGGGGARQPDGSGPDDGADDDDGGNNGGNNGGGSGSGNRAPTVMGPVRLNDVFAGQIVLIALVYLLQGASDPDGDTLSVENVVIKGANLVATADGWLLETKPGMVGPVLITYRISDSETWVAQEATLEIVRKVMALGDDDDLIVGSPYDDDIFGRGGDDLIDALEGNDHVDGGSGDDHIHGGDGDDVLLGGLGNDVIFGGGGNDLIKGGEGNDRLFGEAGADTIFGEAGDDYIEGGAGKDHLDGGEGNDAIYGGEGIDRLIGGAGHDLLEGGADDDLLEGGEGDDTLKGGAGNDVLVDGGGQDAVYGEEGDDILVASAGNDTMDGGDGYDRLDLSAAQDDMVIDAVGGTSFSGELGTDKFSAIEEITGGDGNDMFILGGKAMVLSGGKGRDTFIFEVTDSAPSLSENVVHKILDFVVGDRVRVRDYDLDRAARDVERDMFEAIYGDDKDDWLLSDIPLQVSHELIDDEHWTFIVADLNGDSIYDLAINIQGVMLTPPDNLA